MRQIKVRLLSGLMIAEVTITPSERGFRFREEVSERSGSWEEAAAFEYVRLGPIEP